MKIINSLLIFFLQFKIINSYQNNFKPIHKITKYKFSSHKKLGYSESKNILFNKLKKNLIYGDNYYNVNCEHVWCQKYFKYKEPMKSDLHIMFLSDSKLNSHRQDYKFSNIDKNFVFINNKGIIVTNNFFNKLRSNNLYKKNNYKKTFEPCKKSKGKISRSIAYYNTVYNNNTFEIDKVIDNNNLIEWNRKYLPSLQEIERNEMIRSYQENINPYVKYPILLELSYNNNFSSYNIFKLSIYSIITIILSDFFKFNLFLKKNIG